MSRDSGQFLCFSGDHLFLQQTQPKGIFFPFLQTLPRNPNITGGSIICCETAFFPC